MAWRLLAWVAGTACRFGDAADASRQAVEHARRAGDVRQERRAATAYAAAASLGPIPVDEAIARCEAGIEQTAGDRQSEGHLLAVLAVLYAMRGEFDHARMLVTRSRSIFDELGLQMEAARLGWDASTVERLAGDLDAATRELRGAYDELERLGETFARSTVAGFLAETLLEQGALDEAAVFCEQSRALTTEADIATEALWRYVCGRILVRQGTPTEAIELVEDAIALLAPTDAIVYQIEAHVALGEALEACRLVDRARAAYETARGLAERKSGSVILRDVLRRIEALDAAAAT